MRKPERHDAIPTQQPRENHTESHGEGERWTVANPIKTSQPRISSLMSYSQSPTPRTSDPHPPQTSAQRAGSVTRNARLTATSYQGPGPHTILSPPPLQTTPALQATHTSRHQTGPGKIHGGHGFRRAQEFSNCGGKVLHRPQTWR